MSVRVGSSPGGDQQPPQQISPAASDSAPAPAPQQPDERRTGGVKGGPEKDGWRYFRFLRRLDRFDARDKFQTHVRQSFNSQNSQRRIEERQTEKLRTAKEAAKEKLSVELERLHREARDRRISAQQVEENLLATGGAIGREQASGADYLARVGIERDSSALLSSSAGSQVPTPAAAITAAAAPPPPSERESDGQFVGADGRTYPPSTSLGDVPAVLPRDGRVTNPGTIIYVNGIRTDQEAQSVSLQKIADRAGAPVIGVRNATRGTALDLIQSAGDMLDIGRNPAVDTLRDTIYGEIKAGRGVHLMAHSQGGLITSRALQDVRNKLMLENFFRNPFTARRETERMLGQVRVETFGGAAPSYPDGPQYVHYVNRLDPIPGVFGLGPVTTPGTNPGRGAIVHRFTQKQDFHDFDTTYLSRRVDFDRARRGDFD